ncbi:hypothetical protein ISD48_26010 [Pseudomonas aeruginosa]|nr:hypothetical protein [Pseudomonas aeruginosa]
MTGSKPYGYLRELDGNLQMSIGPDRPADRAGGYATPWVALYIHPATHAPDYSGLLQDLERTHAGHMVGHDQSDQPKGGYSDGYVHGFGECIEAAKRIIGRDRPIDMEAVK